MARPEEKVVWGHRGEEEFENGENKRKLNEQRKRLQKELRDIEKHSFTPQKINSKWS